MKPLLVLLLVTFGFVHHLFAYPIAPRPLRKLVIESQYIIVGYVAKTYPVKAENTHLRAKLAKVAVIENLQGQIEKDTVEIEFFPGLVCPASDNYEDGTYVLAFVDKEADDKYHTHALSYGSKTLSKEGIAIYKKRIVEMQSILKKTNKEVQLKETIAWLIKCAEAEETAWEGVCELNYTYGLPLSDKYGVNEKLKTILTNGQKAFIKKLVLNPKYDGWFGLVDLVYEDYKCEIEEHLINSLKALLSHPYFYADDYIRHLKHRNNSIQMTSLLEEYKKVQYDVEKIDKRKMIIEAFIKLVENPQTIT